MIAAATSHGSKLPAADLAPPKRRALRVLVIGASPALPMVKVATADMGAEEVMSVDGEPAVVARQRLKVTPPDVVLVVGPLWTEGAVLASEVTPTGQQARRYLAGGYPVRWLRGGMVSELRALPAPGAP